MGRFRSCRSCKWFLRIGDDRDDVKPRGFCLLGMDEGDFSLYVDSTRVRDCPFYEEDETSRGVYEAEQAVEMTWIKYRHRAFDGRTRIHREAKKRAGIEGKLTALDIMLDSKFWRGVHELFEEENRELIIKAKEAIAKRSISMERYCSLIYGITEAVKEVMAKEVSKR